MKLELTKEDILKFKALLDTIPTDTVPQNTNMKNERKPSKRKDGRYMLYVIDENKKRKAIYGKTAGEALQKAQELEEAIHYKQTELLFSFDYLFHEWFKSLDIKAQSKDRIEVTYNKYFLNTEFSKKDIRTITSKYLLDYINDLLKEVGVMKKKEFAKVMQIFQETLSYPNDIVVSIDWNWIKRKINKTRITSAVKKEYAIPAEVKLRMEDFILSDRIDESRYVSGLCFRLNFSLGLRIGELASVFWKDIDFDNRTVTITKTETKAFRRNSNGNRISATHYQVSNTTKTDEGIRVVPFTDKAYETLLIIKDYQEKNGWLSPEQRICYNGYDYVSFVSKLSKDLGMICKAAGIDHVNTHLIRKTFASNLHHANVATKTISNLLGHKKISTTLDNYILNEEASPDALRKEMSKVL